MSPVAFRFNLVSNAKDELGVEIEAVPVVPAAALPAILVCPLEEPEYVAGGEVVLDSFQRRERVHSV